MRKEGDDVGVAVPPGCVKEGHARVHGPFLVPIRLMNAPVFASTVKKRFKGISSFVMAFFSLRAPETVLPTKAIGRYADHIWRFCCPVISEGFGKIYCSWSASVVPLLIGHLCRLRPRSVPGLCATAALQPMPLLRVERSPPGRPSPSGGSRVF